MHITPSGVRVVRVCGEIDISNIGEMSDAAKQAVKDSPRGFILDLSGASYIDSSGIGVVIVTYRDLRPEGRLAIVATNACVRHQLTLIRPDQLPGMTLHEDLSSAEQAIIQEQDMSDATRSRSE